MKTTFEELKAELLLKAKNNKACESGYSRAEKCETEEELLQVIADNFSWVWRNKTITIKDLNKFDSGLLQSIGIFANYEGSIVSDLSRLIIVGASSPRIVTYGSSSPTVETYGSSSPRVETYDSSSPRISGLRNCIAKINLSIIIDLDNLIIHKSDKWRVL